jgi:ferritin heavy chain
MSILSDNLLIDNLSSDNLITNNDTSIARLSNWHVSLENILNRQITLQLFATNSYLYLFEYFMRDNIGYKNIAEYFKKQSYEQKNQVEQLIKYQGLRGGIVRFDVIEKPDDFINHNQLDIKSDIQMAFEYALKIQQEIYQSLLNIYNFAEDKNDPSFSHYIKENFLSKHLEIINQISTYIGQISKIKFDGYGLYQFDLSFKL